DQCAQLQSDLDNLQSWEKEVLRVTRKKSMIHHDYTLHGKVHSPSQVPGILEYNYHTI
ncbi:Hypothetical predicted protein, partial [Paramuricea clavata]